MGPALYIVLLLLTFFGTKVAVLGKEALQIGAVEKFVAVAGLVLFISYVLYCQWEKQWYLSLLPQEIETSGTVFIGGESGLREGCGAAIFNLSDASAKEIERQGIRFFDTAVQSRGHKDSYHRYGKWQPTPISTEKNYEEKELWVLGMGCAHLERERAIPPGLFKALETEGAYFARKPEGGLIVIPKLKIVVFSYNG